MEKRNMLKGTRIVYENSKLGLLNYLEAHVQICEDGLNYYDQVYASKKSANNISFAIADQQLIRLELDYLSSFDKLSLLKEYVTLNTKLTSSLIFKNSLFDKNKADYKLVFSDLANLLKKICESENEISIAFKTAWENNNFDFTIDELFEFEGNSSPTASLEFNREHLIRYFIKRRKASLESIQTELLSQSNEIEEINELYDESYEKYSELIVDSLETAIFVNKLKPKNRKLRSSPPPSFDDFEMGSTGYSEFNEFRDEIHKMDDELKSISRKLVNEPEAKEQYLKDYSELTRKKNAYQFMVTKKAEELNLIQRGLVKVKDNIYDNKSSAKMAATKTILATAGVTFGKAIFKEIAGKGEENDWGKIGEQLAYDAGQAITSGVLTLLMGPVGGTLSAQLFSFIRPVYPKPDLHMNKMVEIQKQIEKGFDQLNLKIDDLEAKLSRDIQTMGEKVTKDVQINRQLDEFMKHVRKIHVYLNQIREFKSDMFSSKRSIKDDELFSLNDKIINEFNYLLVCLFNDQSSLHSSENEGNLKLGNTSVIQQIMTISVQKDGVNKNFMEVVELLLPLLDGVFYLGQEYLKLLPKLTFTEAAVFWFVDTTTSKKDQLLAEIADMYRLENDTKAKFFTTFYLIYQNVIGQNNFEFYQLNRYAWKSMNERTISSGFALLEVDKNEKNDKQYVFDFVNDSFKAEGRFQLKTVNHGNYYRYYLLPKTHLQGNTLKDNALYTFQSNELCLPIDVKFGLWSNDTVKIINGSDEILARVASVQHTVFKNSIESAMLQSPHYVQKNAFYSLPQKNRWLEFVDYKHPNWEIKVFELEGSDAVKHAIDSLGLSLPESTTNVQLTKTLFGNFRVTGELNILEISENSTVSNYFLKNQKLEMIESKLTESQVTFLQSENKRYRVKQCFYNFEGKFLDIPSSTYPLNKMTRTYLFDGDKLVGSIFDWHKFEYSGDTSLRMQEDGNFVLYDINDKVISATDTHANPKNTFLHLTNAGKLVLISNDTKKITKTIDIKNAGSNRLDGGQEMRVGNIRISNNGKYILKFCYPNYLSSGTPRMNLLLSNGKTFKSVFKDNSWGYHDRENLKYYVRLHGGTLRITSWEYNKVIIGANETIIFDHRTLSGDFEGTNTYLELSNEGKLNVHRIGSDQLLGTLFDFHG